MRLPFRQRDVTPTTIPDATTALFLAMGTANIIMQLALPGVGRGVVESRVESGSAFKHVIKRQRTTGQFLAVALIGSDDDRRIYHDAIREVHAHVRSRKSSAVRYSGNDPHLQEWVAMCLFKGYLDSWELLYGRLDDLARNRLLAQGATLGTTLEMRADDWPATFDEFEKRWAATLPKLSIDPEVREHLTSLADLTFLHSQWGAAGRIVSRVFGPQLLFMTKATLPSEFRDLMGWSWSAHDERNFQRQLAIHRAVDFAAPWFSPVALRGYLLDLRLRQALGLPALGTTKLTAAS